MIYENWVEVVDDDPEIRKMLALILQVHGFGVRTHDGAQAYLSATPLIQRRVMLLDVRMPMITGIELKALMTQTGDTTPVIFMSGESLPHEQIAAQASDAVAFLWKPFRTEGLLEAIEKGLKSWNGLANCPDSKN
jgi:FixJ family two-component response regulator